MNVPLSAVTVPTIETVAYQYFISSLISVQFPTLFIGLAGSGKTQLAKGILKNTDILDPSKYTYVVLNFNFYTDSVLLQSQLEGPLKKTGKTFQPAGNLNLIYFVDDLNMPKLDPYMTQNSIALIRQHIDYSHWFDRTKPEIKTIANTQ